ncbi:MAG: hypothetical protein HOM96_00215 [Rickettsiales bacterium]|nr:hypothetical protein [Rickettsiales bacterium]
MLGDSDEDLLQYFEQKCLRKNTDMLFAITEIKNKLALITEDQSLQDAVLDM